MVPAEYGRPWFPRVVGALVAWVVAGLAPACSRQDAASGGERLFLGTGEYNAQNAWDAILRFDHSELLEGAAAAPNGTMPAKQLRAAGGPVLNFPHGLFYDDSSDELYVASLFTQEGDDFSAAQACALDFKGTRCGSVGVVPAASQADGAVTLARHIAGDQTQINKPHGVWVDRSRNVLYLANTMSEDILVWDNASSRSGNVPPDRRIRHQGMGAPVFVFVDEANDRGFVAIMGSQALDSGSGPRPAVVVFNDFSSRNGEVVPSVRIYGENTRLGEGNNRTTHNVWFDAASSLLYVGHHTNEILVFDLSAVNLDPGEPVDLDLAPRVLRINDQADLSDQYDWSTYGLFYLAKQDRLYVSAGNTVGGTASASGPPNNPAAKHVVKVYEGVSRSSTSGVLTPARRISWDNVNTYYPPQPLWVDSWGD